VNNRSNCNRTTDYRFVCWRAALLATAVLVGCSKESTKGTVTGTVTIDGKPAASGALTFIPVDGMAPTAGGMIEEGKYSAEVPFGRSIVQIRVPKKVGERKLYNEADSDVMPIMVESLPAKYNTESEIEIDVTPGINEHDFKVSTK
jgi:hypothetical protein